MPMPPKSKPPCGAQFGVSDTLPLPIASLAPEHQPPSSHLGALDTATCCSTAHFLSLASSVARMPA